MVNYYAGGSPLPGRNFNSNSYRYGAANGQEKVDEISGTGNHYTALHWEYDPRLIFRWNNDPVVKPWQSPYACYSGNPIWRVDPNGDDDYKVDKKGNISLKKKTDSESDKLISRSGFLGLKKNTIDVDKGVLNNIRTGEVKDGNDNVKYDYMGMMGEEKGKALFEFLAKNTEVEWSRMRFGEGGFQSSIISTSHEQTREAGSTGLLQNPLVQASDLRGHDHSHPFGEWHPSGSVHAPGSPERRGDVKFAEWVEKIYSGKQIIFRIYTANDAQYTTYDSKTYLPLQLKEVEITAPKKK